MGVVQHAAQLTTAHATFYFDDDAEEGDRVRAWIENCRNAARVRFEFAQACREGNSEDLAEIAHYVDDESAAMRGARSVLGEVHTAFIRAAGGEPYGAIEAHRGAQRAGSRLLERLAPREDTANADPAAVAAARDDEALRALLARAAPGFLAVLDEHVREMEERRARIEAALGRTPPSDEGAAVALATDAALLAQQWPEEHVSVGQRAARWADEIEAQSRPRAGESEDAAQWRIARLAPGPEATHAARRLAPQGAERIERARTAERTERERLCGAIAAAEQDLRSDDAAMRRRGRKTLGAITADRLSRARLAAATLRRIEAQLQSLGRPRARRRGA